MTWVWLRLFLRVQIFRHGYILSNIINFRSFEAKAAAVFVTIVLLVILNARARPAKTTMQVEFEEWAQVFFQKPVEELTASSLPTVILDITSQDQKRPQSWKLEPADNEPAKSRIIRILELAREANIFSLQPTLDEALESSVISLEVKSNNKVFRANFGKRDLDSNMQAALMLKLFEIYSKEESALAKGERGNT